MLITLCNLTACYILTTVRYVEIRQYQHLPQVERKIMSNTSSPFLDVNGSSVYIPDQKLSASNLKNLAQHIKHIPQFADGCLTGAIAVQKQKLPDSPYFVRGRDYDINLYLYALIEADTAEELEAKKAAIKEELVLYEVNYQNEELSMEIISKPSIDGVTYLEQGVFEIVGEVVVETKPIHFSDLGENPIGHVQPASDKKNIALPYPPGSGCNNYVSGLARFLNSNYIGDYSPDVWQKNFACSFRDADYVDYRLFNLGLLQKNGAILLDEGSYSHYVKHLPLKVIVGQIKSGDSFDDVVFCDNDYIYGWAISWRYAHGDSAPLDHNTVYPAVIPLQDVDMNKLKKQFDIFQTAK